MFRYLLAGVLAAPGLTGIAQAVTTPKIASSVMLNVPVYETPQASDGRLYVTSIQPSGPNVFALDDDTGKLLWSFATQGAITIPPTVGKNQVFVASDIGSIHFLRALDAETGLLIWKYTRNQPPECMCSQASIVSGNLLFAQSDGHSLYAFKPGGAAPAKRIWRFKGDGATLTSPVVAGGLVVFGSDDHNVYALDAKTGAVRWTGTTGYVFTAPPLIRDGVVVIGDQGGNIDGFDLKTGTALWSFAAGAIDDAAISDGDTAYLVSEDHSVYALNIKNGQQVWQHAMDDYAQYAPILAGNLVIVANRAGELVALDTKDGAVAWESNLDGTPFSQPAFWQNANAIVLKIGDHTIGAFNAASGKSLWRYDSQAVVTPPVVNGKDIDLATSTGKVIALE